MKLCRNTIPCMQVHKCIQPLHIPGDEVVTDVKQQRQYSLTLEKEEWVTGECLHLVKLPFVQAIKIAN